MTLKIVNVTLPAAVASTGTFAASYPEGTNAGSFAAFGHRFYSEGLQASYAQDNGKMSVLFQAANIVVTNNSLETLPAGSNVILQLNQTGQNDRNQVLATFDGRRRMVPAPTTLVFLGAPITADADGICESQAVVVATTPLAILDGVQSDLYLGSHVQLDVPRNVVAAWTGASIITITGKDEYGVTMVERSASGTALTGKKAFKMIDSVSFSANVTAATVGFGDVLGLPFYLGSSLQILQERQDNALATSVTPVFGVQTAATATTGDVRGTYDPSAACDGTKSFSLLIVSADPKYRGSDQYAGVMETAMIKPSVGRVVWFYSSKAPEKAFAAIVAQVHGDRMVNLMVIDADGDPYGQTSVQLLQDDDKPKGAAFWCTWMPYQLGQAARTEAAEARSI